MKRLHGLLAAASAIFAIASAAIPSAANAQEGVVTPQPVVTTPRVYVLDCGEITNRTPEDFGLQRSEVKYIDFANMCFLVVHPKGTILWDAGLPDEIVGRPLYETYRFGYGLIKHNTLRGQLAAIGYTPDKIDYLALSHSHFDHVGNAGMFSKSTWLTSREERDHMFAAKPGEESEAYEDFKVMKSFKTKLIPENYDVFGDGTVVIMQAFGHSPGHNVMGLKLRDTGAIVLAGDLYHYPEERSLRRIGEHDSKTTAPQARLKVDKWVFENRAQMWLAHDMTLFARAIKAPGFYE